jgi:hypothetical protein
MYLYTLLIDCTSAVELASLAACYSTIKYKKIFALTFSILYFWYCQFSFYDYRDQLLGVAQPDGAVSSSHLIIILFSFFV